MRHIILLLILLVGGYFVWFYSPKEVKRAARRFSKTHLFRVVLLVAIVIFVFTLQATFGSAKFF